MSRAAWRMLGTSLVLLACGAAAPLAADAAPRAHRRAADSRSAGHPVAAAAPISPAGPPLAGSEARTQGVSGEEGSRAASPAVLDPLVSNGLSSPLCADGLAGGGASGSSRRHCETSGFLAAPAPTGNYGIDVHIDTGALGFGTAWLLSAVQEILLTPVWMAVVWAVHALVVMLEWAFTIDLLDSAAAGGLGRGLRQTQAAITLPWLAGALSVASALALYNGLVRRRVSETLGHALLMGAMVLGGMWVIVDPMGTVGSLGAWANQASLGTLAVVARGSPSAAGRVLGDGLDSVFVAAVEDPWCYLEFGDVSWCRDPARIDRRLRAAGLVLADAELALIGCNGRTRIFGVCIPPASAQVGALQRSARLLREARSNGALFLALPANGPARNSISERGSLLRIMCASPDVTDCRGSAAAQAGFRTASGTWPRMGGLLLIVAGAVGLLLLLGFIAVRLLAASLFSLLYLLLAPGMVLAPAFGEVGRALFRRWVAQLLGAVVSKLIFSFLLGGVLAVGAILSGLTALGWWTQWLLMSAFWWSAYTRRHEALGLGRGVIQHRRPHHPRPLVRRLSGVAGTPMRAVRMARTVGERLGEIELGGDLLPTRARAEQRQPRRNVQVGADEQARRTLERDDQQARALVQAAPAIRERLVTLRARRERLHGEQSAAAGAGRRRRALELTHRGAGLDAEIAREEVALATARRLVGTRGTGARGRSRGESEGERLRERTRFLDDQARLAPAAASGGAAGKRRDYAALAGLAGLGSGEYRRLDRGAQRAARLEIDRELARRPGVHVLAGEPGAGMRAPGPSRGPVVAARREGSASIASAGESPVMRDLREVAAGRKRQIGIDRD